MEEAAEALKAAQALLPLIEAGLDTMGQEAEVYYEPHKALLTALGVPFIDYASRAEGR